MSLFSISIHLMQPYYYLSLIVVFTLFILLIRSLILRKRNIPAGLFVEALRNENSGHFEEAVINYEKALDEVQGNRFYDGGFKNRIIEKIKVLNTIIEYKNGLHITR
jgi:hypothetical protein